MAGVMEPCLNAIRNHSGNAAGGNNEQICFVGINLIGTTSTFGLPKENAQVLPAILQVILSFPDSVDILIGALDAILSLTAPEHFGDDHFYRQQIGENNGLKEVVETMKKHRGNPIVLYAGM